MERKLYLVETGRVFDLTPGSFEELNFDTGKFERTVSSFAICVEIAFGHEGFEWCVDISEVDLNKLINAYSISKDEFYACVESFNPFQR